MKISLNKVHIFCWIFQPQLNNYSTLMNNSREGRGFLSLYFCSYYSSPSSSSSSPFVSSFSIWNADKKKKWPKMVFDCQLNCTNRRRLRLSSLPALACSLPAYVVHALPDHELNLREHKQCHVSDTDVAFSQLCHGSRGGGVRIPATAP